MNKIEAKKCNNIYSIFQNMACHTCKQQCTKIVQETYFDDFKYIYKLCHVNGIINKICEYLYHTNGHTIYYTFKARGHYSKYKINVCTKCFQIGIAASLDKQQRLPFLRRDIDYFLTVWQNIENEQLNEIKERFLNYIFPNEYSCEYYRSQIPTKVNNYNIIHYK